MHDSCNYLKNYKESYLSYSRFTHFFCIFHNSFKELRNKIKDIPMFANDKLHKPNKNVEKYDLSF